MTPPMRISHVNLPMQKGREDDARAFYGALLGLDEIPKPEELKARGGCWFACGAFDIHLSIAADAAGEQRHVGIEVNDVDALESRLRAGGVEIDKGRPAPWKRFFARDPFGNRIEFHDVGALRAG